MCSNEIQCSTWANAKSTIFFYAVRPQSAITGLPTFPAGSGWLFGSIGLLWLVDLVRNWVVLGGMEARHLEGR